MPAKIQHRQEVSMIQPIILKSEDVWLWYISRSRYDTKGMIRDIHRKSVAKEFGKLVVHAFDVNNQSSLSNRGFLYLFVQVYLHPLKGSSTNPSRLIALLNPIISCGLPPSLFLSLGLLMRFKSPTISQFSRLA